MSIDQCENCDAFIDTDEALDCYREINIERMGLSSAYTFDIACICDTCWEARNTEPDEPEPRERDESDDVFGFLYDNV